MIVSNAAAVSEINFLQQTARKTMIDSICGKNGAVLQTPPKAARNE
jgi:hypothetical protein